MYSIVVVLGREVVDGGVLVEVVGGVGFAFGGRAVSHLAYARGRMYSDVVVGIGNIVCGNKLVSDVVTILIAVLQGVAAKKVGGVISDVVVVTGDIVCGDELVADVVAVLLVIDKNTATTTEGRSPL